MKSDFVKRHFLLSISLTAVIALGAFFFVHRTVAQAKLNSESQRYADEAMIAVASNWNEQALLDRGSEELLEAAQFQIDLDAQFGRWRALGPMVRFNGLKGEVAVNFSLQTGKLTTALYFGSADFARGRASLAVGLVKRADRWQVASFRVTPIFERRNPANFPAQSS